MGFNRGHFVSSLAGLIVGALLVSIGPAVAANGDFAVMGTKNSSANATKFIGRNATQFENRKAGKPALRLIVTPGSAPMAVNSTGKVDDLNTDLLDGLDSTAFSLAGHLHAGYAALSHGHAWTDLTPAVPDGILYGFHEDSGFCANGSGTIGAVCSHGAVALGGGVAFYTDSECTNPVVHDAAVISASYSTGGAWQATVTDNDPTGYWTTEVTCAFEFTAAEE